MARSFTLIISIWDLVAGELEVDDSYWDVLSPFSFVSSVIANANRPQGRWGTIYIG